MQVHDIDTSSREATCWTRVLLHRFISLEKCYCSKVSSLPCFDYWIGQRCTCLLVEKGTGDLKAGGMGGAPPTGWPAGAIIQCLCFFSLFDAQGGRWLSFLLARIKKINPTVWLIDGKVGNFFWKLESNAVKAGIEVLWKIGYHRLSAVRNIYLVDIWLPNSRIRLEKLNQTHPKPDQSVEKLSLLR